MKNVKNAFLLIILIIFQIIEKDLVIKSINLITKIIIIILTLILIIALVMIHLVSMAILMKTEMI